MAKGRPMTYARRNGGWSGLVARAWTMVEGAKSLRRYAEEGHDHLATALRLRTTSRLLTKSHGLSVLLQGDLPQRPTIFVTNATGYVEAAACCSVTPCLPLVSADVLHWPVLGSALRASGAIFVRHKDPRSRFRTMLAARRRLQVGASLLAFGSTRSGHLLDLFELAQRTGTSITPVRAAVSSRRMRWPSGGAFLEHYLLAAQLRRAQVYLTYLPSFMPTMDRPPREWLFTVHQLLSNGVKA